MIDIAAFNPPRNGEGDHEVVEGARLNRCLCVFPSAPSVTRSARATSPQAGRI